MSGELPKLTTDHIRNQTIPSIVHQVEESLRDLAHTDERLRDERLPSVCQKLGTALSWYDLWSGTLENPGAEPDVIADARVISGQLSITEPR